VGFNFEVLLTERLLAVLAIERQEIDKATNGVRALSADIEEVGVTFVGHVSRVLVWVGCGKEQSVCNGRQSWVLVYKHCQELTRPGNCVVKDKLLMLSQLRYFSGHTH